MVAPVVTEEHEEMIRRERSRRSFEAGQEVSGALFWYVHGGLLQASEKLEEWDPYLKRPVAEVLEESFAKGWQHLWPKPGKISFRPPPYPAK